MCIYIYIYIHEICLYFEHEYLNSFNNFINSVYSIYERLCGSHTARARARDMNESKNCIYNKL